MDDRNTFISCNTETVDDIKKRVIKIKTFLEGYKWIADAYVSDFFVHGFWSQLPPRWTQYLTTLSPPEISFLLKHDGQTYSQVPPLSLLSFRMCVLSLALGRCPVDLDNEDVVKNILDSLTSKQRFHSETIDQKNQPDQTCVQSKEVSESVDLENEKYSLKSDQPGENSDKYQINCQSKDVNIQINGDIESSQERERKIVSKYELDEISQQNQKSVQSTDNLFEDNCKGTEQVHKISSTTNHETYNPGIVQTSTQENVDQKSDQSTEDLIGNTNKGKVIQTSLSTNQESCRSGNKTGTDCIPNQPLIEDSNDARIEVPSLNSSLPGRCNSDNKTSTDCIPTQQLIVDSNDTRVEVLSQTLLSDSSLPESYNSAIKTDTASKSTGQHGEEVQRLKVGSSRLADREKWRGVMKNGQWMELEHIYRKHIKPKKQHEIQKLSQAISYVCCLSQSDQVVDVGAGLGHLSRLLTFGHGVKVTTVEASGGHAPKASKYDRETKKDIKKAKLKKLKLEGKVEEPTEPLVSLPSHVSCMIHPNISTPHFLDLIRCSRSQQQTDNEEQTVLGSHLEKGNKMDEKSEKINSSNGRKNLICEDQIRHTDTAEQMDEVSHFEKDNKIDENCEKSDPVRRFNGLNLKYKDVDEKGKKAPVTSCCRKHPIQKEVEQRTGEDRQAINGSHFENQTHIENKETNLLCQNGVHEQRTVNEQVNKSHLENYNVSDENIGKSSICHEVTSDLSIETRAKTNEFRSNSDQNVSNVDYACSNNQRENVSKSSSKCPRSPIEDGNITEDREKMATDPIFDKNQPQGDREEFVLAGLHACGDLTPTLVRMFVNCEAAVGLASVGCCYMKLSQDGKHVESSDPGYPMSQFVSGLPDPDLSYSSRELACHFADAYIQRLQDNPRHLKIHSYRAALQHVIISLVPGFKHGVTKLTIKNAAEKPFESYVRVAMEKLGYKSEIPGQLLTEAESYLPLWKDVVIFYTIRLSLAPVIETLVLLDRMLYLFEQGIPSALVPIFDPKLSPRNFVLLAVKPEHTGSL